MHRIGFQSHRVMGKNEREAEAEEEGKKVVLTAPLALEGGLAAEHRPPNLLQQVLGLFCNVRLGSDLTRFQLPSLFNMPKSQLQCYGEVVYCYNEDYLCKCAQGQSKLNRFVSVVAWSISTTRPAIFGQAPYNPILGETHHVSRGSLNVLLEQVSHHPPVTALHATDTNLNIELIWCHSVVPRFHGTSVEAAIKGKRQLRLLTFGENYEMDSPNLMIKLIPPTGADWTGNVRIRCKDSELEADLCYYKSHRFLGFGGTSRFLQCCRDWSSLRMELYSHSAVGHPNFCFLSASQDVSINLRCFMTSSVASSYSHIESHIHSHMHHKKVEASAIKCYKAGTEI